MYIYLFSIIKGVLGSLGEPDGWNGGGIFSAWAKTDEDCAFAIPLGFEYRVRFSGFVVAKD